MYFENSGVILSTSKTDLIKGLPSPSLPPQKHSVLTNPVLRMVRPLSIAAQFMGLMPIGGMGNDSAQDLQIWSILFRLLIPVAILALMFTELALSVRSTYDPSIKQPASINYASGVLHGTLSRLLTIGTVIHFWLKAPALVRHFRQWEEQPLLSGKSVHALGRLAWILMAVTITVTSTYTVADILKNKLWNNFPLTLVILRFCVLVYESFAFCYVHLIAVFFQKALTLAYKELSVDIEAASMTSNHVSESEVDDGEMIVAHLRIRHEHIRQLLLDMNSLMSPLLVVAFLTDAVCMCYFLYTAVNSLTDAKVPLLEEFCPLLVLCSLRAVTTAWHCISATSVGQEASSGLKHMYGAPLTSVSPECRFQLRLLESKMTSCPITMTASDFADINHGLLVQILGIVATYVLVMVQFKK